jgi:hypothetical protein
MGRAVGEPAAIGRRDECLAPLSPAPSFHLTNHATGRRRLLHSNVCLPGRIEMRKCLPGDATARHIRATLPGHPHHAGRAPRRRGHRRQCLVTAPTHAAVSGADARHVPHGRDALAMRLAMRLAMLQTLVFPPSPLLVTSRSLCSASELRELRLGDGGG